MERSFTVMMNMSWEKRCDEPVTKRDWREGVSLGRKMTGRQKYLDSA